jgi:hypothetical protein
MNIVDLRQKNNADRPASPAGEREISVEDQRLISDVAKQQINPQRRQLLKFLLIGAGAFIAGFLTRHLIPFSKPSKYVKEEGLSEKETEVGDWKIKKMGKETIFIDKRTNEEAFILD